MTRFEENRAETTRNLFKNQVMDQIDATGLVVLNPDQTIVLLIDIVNDGVSESGFLKSMLGADISYLQNTVAPSIRFVENSQKSSVSTCFVQPVYDFRYLSSAMCEQFKSQGIPDIVYKKGSWGAKPVDSLPSPNLQLVKSNFSLFSERSFMFRPECHPEIIDYLSREADDDQSYRAQGRKTMGDYFSEATRNSRDASRRNIDQITERGVVSLDAYLTAKQIDTIIIGGMSTNVCVDAAVCGASERGYHIIIPVDMTGSEDHEKHWSYLNNFGQFKGKLTTSDRISFSRAAAV